MNFALLLLCGIVAASSNIAMRTFQTKIQTSLRQLLTYQIIYISIAVIVLFLLSPTTLPADPQLWLLVVAFGLCIAISSIGSSEALLNGPMSLTSVIVSCNVVMPILFGCLIHGESLSLFHLGGIILLLITFLLSGAGSKGAKKEISGKWYLFLAMGFLGNGFGAIVISARSKLPYENIDMSFLAFSFLLAVVILSVFALFCKIREKDARLSVKPSWLLVATVLPSAISIFGVNILLFYLVTVYPTAVLYPIYNASTSVIVCVSSCLFFREPMNKQKLLTLTLGIGAVVLLNL